MALLKKPILAAPAAYTAAPAAKAVALIPDNTHVDVVVVTAAEVEYESGDRLELRLNVIGGMYDGHELEPTMWIEHPSEKAMAYSKKAMQQLLKSVGIVELVDTDTLIGKKFRVRANIQKSEDPAYPDKNGVWEYMPIPDSKPAAPAPVVRTVAAPAPANGNERGFGRNILPQ